MCDFRGPPDFIINHATKEKVAVTYGGIINGGDCKDVRKEGMYYIATTGSYYAYFDGQQWWKDRNEWGPVTECSKELFGPEGMPEMFRKYGFMHTDRPHYHSFVLNDLRAFDNNQYGMT